MPKVSIFIRTYKRDVAWLDFCLQSIHANLKGWHEIVVAVPEGQESHLRFLGSERRVATPRFAEDYVGQQVAKLQAHRHVTGDYVFFVDSDVIFLPGADIAHFLNGDQPIIGKRRYATLERERSPSTKWQPIVADFFGETPEWEYMRGHGCRLYRTDTLRALSTEFPQLETYARAVPKRRFSEFNLLGFFAESREANRYRFVDDATAALPDSRTRQFWTIDGLTPKALAELAQLGFHPRWPSTLSWFDRAKAWISQTTRAVKKRLKSRRP